MAGFKIDPEHDIKLLPFSPVSEKDILEIRVQGLGDTESGEAEVTFELDGKQIETKRVFVKENSYSFASFKLSMNGKAGKHLISINGNQIPLEVTKEKLPILDGGFVSIGPPNDRVQVSTYRADLKSMTDEDWEKYIDGLAEIGCKCIIIQNCQEYRVYNNFNPNPDELTAHYKSKLHPKSDITADDPIGDILRKAEQYGMNVFLSVGNCYGYTPCDEDCFEIFRLFGKYKSFYGWYLSNEADMRDFKVKDWDFIRHQVKLLREISPVKPVLISPFNFPSDEAIAYIKNNDVFDIMMPQDCVGQEALTLEQSDLMHKRLAEACDILGKHLWANCESFNFKDGLLVPRYKNGGMKGEGGFIGQVKTVAPYVEKTMNFAYMGFFTPEGFTPKINGDAAVKQYKEYKEYYEEMKKCQ